MAWSGGLALALSALLFATRWVRTGNQPLVVLATFAHLAPLPAVLGAGLLALSGTAAWTVALAVVAWMLAVEARPFAHPRTGGDHVLTVVTANVWFGRARPDAVLALARRADADVLALQETTHEFVAGLEAAGVAAEYPYTVVAAGPLWSGAGLWSRRPLREESVTRRGTLNRVAATVRIGEQDSPDDPVVTSVHIHAPWPGAPGPWLDQLDEIGVELAGARHPMIVAGDFNATLDHAPFRALLHWATDAAVAARAWWAPTWPGHLPVPPVIAIDHVLLRGLTASHAWTADVEGADHGAVTARVVRLG